MLYSPDSAGRGFGEPLLIVGSEHTSLQVTNVELFARQRVAATAHIVDVVATAEGFEEIDGESAYIIVATANDEETGLPLLLYQMVVLAGSGHVLLQGMVAEDLSAKYLPQFQAVARSLTLR